MKNQDRYKTAHERSEAFEKFCKKSTTDCGMCMSDCKLFYDQDDNKSYRCHCEFRWLDPEAEDDSVVIECNGHRYKAKNAKAHLSGDMLVITGCSGVRGDLSAEIRVEKIEQDNRVTKKCREVMA